MATSHRTTSPLLVNFRGRLMWGVLSLGKTVAQEEQNWLGFFAYFDLTLLAHLTSPPALLMPPHMPLIDRCQRLGRLEDGAIPLGEEKGPRQAFECWDHCVHPA
jgi:hypothetical protein